MSDITLLDQIESKNIKYNYKMICVFLEMYYLKLWFVISVRLVNHSIELNKLNLNYIN